MSPMLDKDGKPLNFEDTVKVLMQWKGLSRNDAEVAAFWYTNPIEAININSGQNPDGTYRDAEE